MPVSCNAIALSAELLAEKRNAKGKNPNKKNSEDLEDMAA